MRFQQRTLSDKCLYLESQNKELSDKNNKLNDKVKKQREFLYSAKDEIAQLTKEKTNLELELQQLREKERPQTIDLSEYDTSADLIIHEQREQPKSIHNGVRGSHNTFLSQFRSDRDTRESNNNNNNANQPITSLPPGRKQRPPTILQGLQGNTPVLPIVPNEGSRRQSFFAESTKIGEVNSILSASSGGTTSTPSSSRHLELAPPSRISSGSSNGTSKLSGKMRKSRSLTTQLASRIAANMKIGPPASAASSAMQMSIRLQNDRIRKPPTLNRSLRRGTDVSPYFRGA
ncbi:uncharacterized protein J8A68_002565 [[Candida] subhashii]|uniref:Uncharacterized protein n=1 Tax=[Candida] subhashii TaxID=561895 RepID=A0A8J5QPB6_9ASCO|nr:uncharacterized protein J8A68_002565 [[Candida] subhashii]KAG7663938.1 hypothetical protein J8A68_002565 [[Candida] subhashii]